MSLDKPKVRRQLELTSVEGVKEIEMALEGNYEFQSLFYNSKIADKKLIDKISNRYKSLELYEISDELFKKTAYRESTGGLIAILKTSQRKLSNIVFEKSPLILIIDGVEKPGNIGAILRTADAAAIDMVICSDLPGDLYNPNTIRASLGTVFTVPIYQTTGLEAREWLKQNEITTYCTNLHKAIDYLNVDFRKASAIVVGTEAFGVSKEWVEFADYNVKIPMNGKIDSMNVSVATAIMVFEAQRQRR